MLDNSWFRYRRGFAFQTQGMSNSNSLNFPIIPIELFAQTPAARKPRICVYKDTKNNRDIQMIS